MFALKKKPPVSGGLVRGRDGLSTMTLYGGNGIAELPPPLKEVDGG